MHNLHLIKIKASSPKSACSVVENYLLEFAKENNRFYVICGCVSEKDEVYIYNKNSRYCPDENSNSIEKINRMIDNWINTSFNFVMGLINSNKTPNKKLIKSLEEITSYKNKEFNVLTDSYCEYQYTECGVTQMEDKDKNGVSYVVFVDMKN